MLTKDNYFAIKYKLLDPKLKSETAKKVIVKKDIFFFPEAEDEKKQINKLNKLNNYLCDSNILTDYTNTKEKSTLINTQEKERRNKTPLNMFNHLIAPENKLSIKKSREKSMNKESSNNSIINSRILTNFNNEKEVKAEKVDKTEKEILSNNKLNLLNLRTTNNTPTHTDNENISFLTSKKSNKDKLLEFKKSIENGFERTENKSK